jgi:hypothetical protein
MNEYLSDFERELHLAVSSYLSEARLELVPAAVVEDILNRPGPRRLTWSRRLLLGVAAAAAAVIMAVVMLPLLRPAVLPPAATPTGTVASNSPLPANSPLPSPTPTPTAKPSPTPRPTSKPSPSPTQTVPPTPFTLVFDGSQAGPFRLPEPSSLAGLRFSAATEATNVRQFAVDLRNVQGVTVIDGGRAALTMPTQTRNVSTVWLADWSDRTIRKFAEGAIALGAWGSGSDAEVLVRADQDGAVRLRRLDVQTGQELARVDVPAPAAAVYLSDGSVAIASASSIGVWTAGELDLKPSALPNVGEQSLQAAGTNVLVGSMLLDPRTGDQVGKTLPFSYYASIAPAGDRIVLVSGAGSYAQYRLEVHDATTGDAVTVGKTVFFDLAKPGPEILAWVTDDAIMTRTHGGLGGVAPSTRLTSPAALSLGMDVTRLIPVDSAVYANGSAMLVEGDGFVRLIDWTAPPP